MDAEITKHVQALENLAKARGQRVALAESCTGGLLSSWICALPGVSSWYQGAVVSYARVVKRDVLGVPETTLAAHGEVSRPVALGMARGARQALWSDWAVSVTGIAGPSGGSPAKPVGTVCFAVVGPGVEQTAQCHFGGSREEVQRQAALFALDFLLKQF